MQRVFQALPALEAVVSRMQAVHAFVQKFLNHRIYNYVQFNRAAAASADAAGTAA